MKNHPALTKEAILALSNTRGSESRSWLADLPDILYACEQEWSLTIESPFQNLSYNYAAYGRLADGTPIVLKISPLQKELQYEAEALQLFAGEGSILILGLNKNLGAMLLERLTPGFSLNENISDEKATQIAAGIMKKLWRPIPAENNFPTTKDWASGLQKLRQRFNGTSGPLPELLVDKAEKLFAELHASQSHTVLLHGDLHHGNILAASRYSWLAIDPKGVIGEPAYEVGAWLRNPLPVLLALPNPKQVLHRRIKQLSELLDLDPERLRAWGIAQAVLSACWSIEDNQEIWQPAIKCAGILAEVIL